MSNRCSNCETKVEDLNDINYCYDCGTAVCVDCQEFVMDNHRCAQCNNDNSADQDRAKEVDNSEEEQEQEDHRSMVEQDEDAIRMGGDELLEDQEPEIEAGYIGLGNKERVDEEDIST